ncbi:NAD(P)H-binding protein [Actinomadura sp. LOL_016]|uniref:NAD(P)H-binding protein n=1 Tax=unclassified Actinomadura TaxID=2626254 RepID=UPI003A801727
MSRRTSVLVTGATGTVGRQVAAQLAEEGVRVRALTRYPHSAEPTAGTEAVRGDLTDPASVRAAVSGVDAVFLVWPFATAEGLPAVLDVVAEHARRVVYLSSAVVRVGERHAEGLIERSGLEWTFLRPHAFSANTLAWAEQIRAEDVVRGPYAAATTAPIHEHDIAAVAVRALLSEGHAGAAYLLTGPKALTQAEQVHVIGEAIGRPVQWIDTPAEDARQPMLARGWPPQVVDDILKAQADLVTTPGPVTSTVREVTGTPARTFRQWADDNADRFRGTVRAAH